MRMMNKLLISLVFIVGCGADTNNSQSEETGVTPPSDEDTYIGTPCALHAPGCYAYRLSDNEGLCKDGYICVAWGNWTGICTKRCSSYTECPSATPDCKHYEAVSNHWFCDNRYGSPNDGCGR